MKDVFICDGIRTPVGRYGGGLAPVRTDDLAAIPIAALMERNPGVDWAAVDDVMRLPFGFSCLVHHEWSFDFSGVMVSLSRL